MFVARLRPLYYISDKVIVRNLRNSRLNVTGANPGLDRRIKAFQNDGLKIEDEDAEEFIEKSDSDFSNAGEAYNEHMNETLMGKYEMRHRIVKDKYFKENMPNLLTWSEKEQIRHLAATEPDEWTPQKLAESFPVTEQIVKKLLKYPWKPATKERIARHDASVMRNWRELKEGSLTISEGLRQHFLKYSDRSIPPLNPSSIKIDLTQERMMGEFESIVKKCAAKQEEKTENYKTIEETETSYRTNNTTTMLVQGPEANKTNIEVKKNNRLTLDELTNKIQKSLDHGENVDLNDEIIIKTIGNDSKQPIANTIHEEIELHEEKSTDVTVFKDDDQAERNIMQYPERIRIPKKAYKRGATYKVNDCYYDHDGKFLYRVLGMSN